MCEANAYVMDKDGNQNLFLERVDTLTNSEDGLILENIFSERKLFKGRNDNNFHELNRYPAMRFLAFEKSFGSRVYWQILRN